MNSPASPNFRNVHSKTKSSPIEIKEKMRKNYKNKIQNCRDLLLNRFRGGIDVNLRNTLNDIYKSMFNFSNMDIPDDEELDIITEIQNELIEEELEWLRAEHEKSQTDNIDWAAVEEDNNLICPVCQKTNCQLQDNVLSCSNCKYDIKTQLSLIKIKQHIFELIEKHSIICDKECQFTMLTELNDTHLYFICDVCSEMQTVV